MENYATRPKLFAPALAAFAIAAIAALAIALPQSAWAASASNQMAAGSAELSAQAASKTMWVLTEVKSDYSTNTYSYNAKGLLTQDKSDFQTTTYTYDKKNRLKSCTYKSEGTKATKTKYSLNKKGWVVKAKSSGSKTAVKYKYDKKGRFLKLVLPYKTGKDQTFSYDKKGNISKVTRPSSKTTYKYDTKGNATKATDRYSKSKSVETLKNTYDENGLLVKVVHSRGGRTTITETYTYQQVTVPKAAQKMVKNQQWALLQQKTHNGWPFVETAHS